MRLDSIKRSSLDFNVQVREKITIVEKKRAYGTSHSLYLKEFFKEALNLIMRHLNFLQSHFV